MVKSHPLIGSRAGQYKQLGAQYDTQGLIRSSNRTWLTMHILK